MRPSAPNAGQTTPASSENTHHKREIQSETAPAAIATTAGEPCNRLKKYWTPQSWLNSPVGSLLKAADAK